MSKHVYIYIKDTLYGILHCDMFKEEKIGGMTMLDLYKLEYDSQYEISYRMFIGNIYCDRYEVKEVENG